MRRAFCLVVAISDALGASVGVPARRRGTVRYVVEVSDVTAKVGEPAVMRATLRVRDGYRVLKAYNNRVIELSSFDDGVAFERKMVPATLRGRRPRLRGSACGPPSPASIRSTDCFASVTSMGPTSMAMVSVPPDRQCHGNRVRFNSRGMRRLFHPFPSGPAGRRRRHPYPIGRGCRGVTI